MDLEDSTVLSEQLRQGSRPKVTIKRVPVRRVPGLPRFQFLALRKVEVLIINSKQLKRRTVRTRTPLPAIWRTKKQHIGCFAQGTWRSASQWHRCQDWGPRSAAASSAARRQMCGRGPGRQSRSENVRWHVSQDATHLRLKRSQVQYIMKQKRKHLLE